jgi:hypothetical protein
MDLWIFNMETLTDLSFLSPTNNKRIINYINKINCKEEIRKAPWVVQANPVTNKGKIKEEKNKKHISRIQLTNN